LVIGPRAFLNHGETDLSLRSWIKYKTDFFGRISSWQRFGREVRESGQPLLAALPQFEQPILVAGCQRSGTTAVSRLFTSGDGLKNFWSRDDEELDAAMILSGEEQVPSGGRYCFQTTYLNERYPEYFEHNGKFKLVWVVRNPYSVIFSMVYNWEDFALHELFDACSEVGRESYKPEPGISENLWLACEAYNGKMKQIYALSEQLDGETLYVLSYEAMVADTEDQLRKLYAFAELDFDQAYCDKIRGDSMDKAKQLSAQEQAYIQSRCEPLYQAVRETFCQA
jgi:hypothetical protein